MIIKNCIICNKEFGTYQSEIKINRGKFCSHKCYWEFLKGKPSWNKGLKGYREGHITSEETKKKIRQSNLGQKRSKETKSKLHLSHLGKPQYNRRKEKSHMWKGGLPKCLDCGKSLGDYLSKRCMRCSRIGNKHPNWKGGTSNLQKNIRKSLEFKKWRENIFERDNYTCKECFKRGGTLHPHHIKSFSKIFQEFIQQYNQFSIFDDRETLLRLAITYEPFWDTNNGKTLCKECHKNITFNKISINR